MIRIPPSAALIALAFTVSAAAAENRLRVTGNWITGCDNTLSCEAVALRPDDRPRGNDMTMSVRRAGDASAGAEFVVHLVTSAGVFPKKAAALAIDGNAIALPFTQKETRIVFGEAFEQLAAIRMLSNGSELTAHDAAGAIIGRASLAGMRDAMQEMDARQGRTETITALIAPGRQPRTAVPQPPPAPVVRVPAAPDRPPRELSPEQIRERQKVFACPDSSILSRAMPARHAYHRLDGATTLGIIGAPCPRSAYNDHRHIVLIDERGAFRDATLDIPATNRRGDILSNAYWDQATSRLRVFDKSRGIGDCGSSHQYAWDGERFRLVERSEMTECAGSTHFIRTWHAETRAR